jgi:hypothetical protein
MIRSTPEQLRQHVRGWLVADVRAAVSISCRNVASASTRSLRK